MSHLAADAVDATIAEHRALGLPTSVQQVQALLTLFVGTLLDRPKRPGRARVAAAQGRQAVSREERSRR
jgi:hypothetical protein